jgi:hypothetical protein
MYGLINKAVEGLVVSSAGEQAWEDICEKAGIDSVGFVSMHRYPDDVTFKLVGAAAEVLGASPDAILEKFGEYWTRYTAQEGYGDLFATNGRTVREFLVNLNAIHARLELLMPEMVLPHFDCEDLPDGTMLLHYRSKRAGLGPMVLGIVRGLAIMFDEQVDVRMLHRAGQGSDHDVLHIASHQETAHVVQR